MTGPIKPEKPVESNDSPELDALKAGRLEAFGDVRERLAKLEGKAEHLTTKHEVERLRLGEVERRVATLESKVDDVRDTCTRISTKMEEIPSKAYVLRYAFGIVTLMILSLLGHLLIRSIGTY